MATTVDVLDQTGKKSGSLELPAEVFDVVTNVPLMHQVVVAQLAAARQGTHKTKGRGEVSGAGRKPFKQKGTGRARQGSIRAPQHRGGGIVHGPVPRDYSQRTPKKMVQKEANKAAQAKKDAQVKAKKAEAARQEYAKVEAAALKKAAKEKARKAAEARELVQRLEKEAKQVREAEEKMMNLRKKIMIAAAAANGNMQGITVTDDCETVLTEDDA